MRKILWAVIVLAASLSACRQAPVKRHLTVVVSLDAFRWDFTQIHDAPWLDSIGRAGVQAVMKPSYPSSTFPNHYTLATGLVPDHHGIVNSSFWDSERGVMYAMGDSATRNRPYYYGGEPIWSTAEKQGVTTACVYWVGSDIPIGGVLPTYYKYWYDEPRLDYAGRVQETLRLAALPEEERPSLIMTYFDDPDWAAHNFGP
jgi:predicted AlkP superfamily pyrophosphatase or phosphodiesterase